MQVTLATHGLKKLSVMSLAATDDRCQNQDFMTGIVVLNHLEQPLLGVFHHRLACVVAVGLSCTGKEQAQEIVYLGGGTNGGTRVLVGGLLLNADDGAESGYLIDIRTLQSAQEVAGIGRERLDVTALALGEDGVEGK